MIAGDHYETGRFTLGEGESLILVSDGVTEAKNAEGDMFEAGRLVETLRSEAGGRGAGDIVKSVLSAVDEFAGGSEQADDISILVIRQRK